jgi:hypothetical protein
MHRALHRWSAAPLHLKQHLLSVKQAYQPGRLVCLLLQDEDPAALMAVAAKLI